MSAPRGKAAKVVELASSPVEGARIGRVVSSEGGRVIVQVEGVGPVGARVAAGLDDAALAQAVRSGAEAVLLFERGDPRRPVLVALLRSESPLLDAVLAGPLPPAEKVARVDGKRVEIQGKDEVVLRCGKASLTLRRDGRVVLRGVNVVSQADAVQKIRGGKVEIN